MLIAHRGESFEAPENTLASIELAWETGSRLVEFDVRRTRDGHFVLSHDADTQRVSGQKRAIADHTLEQLSHLDVGGCKGSQWAGQRLATLRQILATAPADGRMCIEVKGPLDEVEPLIRMIGQSETRNQCILICFRARVIARIKQIMPQLNAYWLLPLQPLAEGGWWPDVNQLIDLAGAIQADGVNLPAPMVNEPSVSALHNAGFKVCARGTSDDPLLTQALLDAGADAVSTNRAAWMRQQLARLRPAAAS